ncbi:MAG TPA: hypothetical protein VK498_03170 [Ferruginibacter sp.]|nr:hypothetical protein [Ferruginibacter sp.]
MLKVTLKISLLLLLGCHPADKEKELEAYEQHLNKEAESTIDAAYISIRQHCDSLIKQKILFRDSIIRDAKRKRKKNS